GRCAQFSDAGDPLAANPPIPPDLLPGGPANRGKPPTREWTTRRGGTRRIRSQTARIDVVVVDRVVSATPLSGILHPGVGDRREILRALGI
ncbi:MAG: hypothetical protein RMK65_12775, partial [Anaerolineae bacterium]|nr:hypothetical protein [Anaerolineae bacterium]